MSKNLRNTQATPPNLYRLPPALASALSILWVAGIYFFRYDLFFHSSSSLSNFFQLLGHVQSFPLFRIIKGLTALSALFYTFIGLARPAIRKLSDSTLDGFEEVLLSLGLGMGGFALALLPFGTLLSYSPLSLRILSGALFGLASISHWRLDAKPWRAFQLPRFPVIRIVVSSALVGLIFLNLLGALGPEVFYDSLSYHLALPQLYLLHGKIFPTPYNIYSGIPFNSEMIYGLSLALGGELLAKLLPWGIGLAIVGVIMAWSRRFVSEDAGWIAALIFYSCPMVAAQNWFTLIELNWSLFSLLAFFCIMLWDKDGSRNVRWLVLAGTFLGLCLGAKYNAASLVVVALAAIFVSGRKNRLGMTSTMSSSFIVVAVALAWFAPWLIKNWGFYRNPIYPFLTEHFPRSDASVNWHALVHDAKGRNLATTLTSLTGMKDLLTFLWGTEWTGFDSTGLAILFGLPVLFCVKSPQEHTLLLVLLASGWLAGALASRMPRFILFTVPLFSIAIAEAGVPQRPSTAFRSDRIDHFRRLSAQLRRNIQLLGWNWNLARGHRWRHRISISICLRNSLSDALLRRRSVY